MTTIVTGTRAQDKDAKPADQPADDAPATPPKEETFVTEKDEPTAVIYFIAYTAQSQNRRLYRWRDQAIISPAAAAIVYRRGG
jgi:hypothetical protein